MHYLEELLHNPILVCSFTAWVTAQILKVFTHLAVYKKLVWERLFGDGGMPSAHSATVSAMAASAFFSCGPSSPEFAIALIFALIVMHDASGVRLETGKQAELLNEIVEIMQRMGTNSLSTQEKLKEFVGHTKIQVCMGALLGVIVAIIRR